MTRVALDISDAVAIDGGAGTGKSFLGMCLAREFGLKFLDSGVIYRVAGYAAIKNNIPLDDANKVAELLRSLNVSIDLAGEEFDMYQVVFVDGVDVSHELFHEDASQAASIVAREQEVRLAVNDQYKRILTDERSVVVGRDIGTNVLPDAKLKIFIKADPYIIARRRIKQRKQDEGILEELVADIRRRDERDAHVLTPADDAIILDNNGDYRETLKAITEMYLQRF